MDASIVTLVSAIGAPKSASNTVERKWASMIGLFQTLRLELGARTKKLWNCVRTKIELSKNKLPTKALLVNNHISKHNKTGAEELLQTPSRTDRLRVNQSDTPGASHIDIA